MNPDSSNHDIVAQLHLTDAQAVHIMGSTGRKATEQKKLDDNPNYDPDNHRVVIAESGAIPPGHKLDALTLVAQPNGATLPPGEYGATIYLIFYDSVTNNRALLESQVAVTIHVSN
jgi:hypothetical protein